MTSFIKKFIDKKIFLYVFIVLWILSFLLVVFEIRILFFNLAYVFLPIIILIFSIICVRKNSLLSIIALLISIFAFINLFIMIGYGHSTF